MKSQRTPFRLKIHRIPNPLQLLRNYFLTGVFVLIPIAVIFWLARAVLRWMWNLYTWIPAELRPPAEWGSFFNGLIFLGGTVVFLFLISILGWISTQYFGQRLLHTLKSLLQRIPFLGAIYTSLDELLRTIAANKEGKFSRVVFVEYPRKGSWAVAFVTGPSKLLALPPGHLNLFVPTVPNPTAGFHLLVPETDVIESNLKVEDAFKLILSLGISQPSEAAQAPRG
jgi:uncharacterized membrane protein